MYPDLPVFWKKRVVYIFTNLINSSTVSSTLHSNLFGVYREAQLESKTGKDTHLLQISPQKDTTSQLDFMGNHLLTLLIKLTYTRHAMGI